MRLLLHRQRGSTERARWRTVLDMTSEHMMQATRLVQMASAIAPLVRWRIVEADKPMCAAYVWRSGRWAR